MKRTGKRFILRLDILLCIILSIKLRFPERSASQNFLNLFDFTDSTKTFAVFTAKRQSRYRFDEGFKN